MASTTKTAARSKPAARDSAGGSSGRRRTDRSDVLARQITRESLGVRTRMLAGVISRLYDEQLQPLGMTGSQFEILALVVTRGPVSVKELAGQLQIDETAMAQTVETMLDAGWIESDDPGPRREVSPTTRGRETLERATPAWRRAQQRATDLLGPSGTRSISSNSASAPLW